MQLKVLFVTLVYSTITFAASPENWPPTVNKEFPNIKMIDSDGREVELRSLKGKPLLIEAVAMTCAGCQAFSGAHKCGAFGRTQPQPDLKSIEEYLPQYSGGISLSDSRLNFVQIIFYNETMNPATKEDVARWRKHFKFDHSSNIFVYGAKKEYQDNHTFAMIPGFFLVDSRFQLQSEALGSNPKTNLYTELMPKIKKVLDP